MSKTKIAQTLDDILPLLEKLDPETLNEVLLSLETICQKTREIREIMANSEKVSTGTTMYDADVDLEN